MKTSVLIRIIFVGALLCLNSLQSKATITWEIKENGLLSKGKIILVQEGADPDFHPNAPKHIFNDKEGHFKEDTPENRDILREVARDRNNSIGRDKFGNDWYTKTLPNGKQVWVRVNDNKIRDGGINDKPQPPQRFLKDKNSQKNRNKKGSYNSI